MTFFDAFTSLFCVIYFEVKSAFFCNFHLIMCCLIRWENWIGQYLSIDTHRSIFSFSHERSSTSFSTIIALPPPSPPSHSAIFKLISTAPYLFTNTTYRLQIFALLTRFATNCIWAMHLTICKFFSSFVLRFFCIFLHFFNLAHTSKHPPSVDKFYKFQWFYTLFNFFPRTFERPNEIEKRERERESVRASF